MELGDLRIEHFEGRLGEVFEARLDGDRVDELRLIEAKSTGIMSSGESFSLLFRGSPEVLLTQHVYELEHEGLGSLSIFLVPIAQKSQGFLYEAVFTRVEEAEGPEP